MENIYDSVDDASVGFRLSMYSGMNLIDGILINCTSEYFMRNAGISTDLDIDAAVFYWTLNPEDS